MAYTTGTATDYKDLLAKLVTFLTTTLPSGERWLCSGDDGRFTQSTEDELIIKGPGSGTDEIFVGIQTYSGTGYYNWKMAGFTGYSSGATFANQSGCTQGRWPRMLLSNGTIPYWFVGNGRRFIVVAKIGGIYEACYLGFALPYGLPSQFPYPLVIGGSAMATDVSNEVSSSQESHHRAFIDPAGDTEGVCTNVPDYQGDYATLKILHGTSWIKVMNRSSNYGRYFNVVWPYIHGMNSTGDPTHADYYGKFFKKCEKNIDGSYPVFPTVIILSNPSNNIFGEFQGCFAVPKGGDSLLSSEDTLTIGSDTYVVFQNTFRTGVEEFWALKLE